MLYNQSNLRLKNEATPAIVHLSALSTVGILTNMTKLVE